MIEILLLILGVVVGYNIRHERQMSKENLVLEQVDLRLRRELEIARNLNQSLLKDVTELRSQLDRNRGSVGVGEPEYIAKTHIPL